MTIRGPTSWADVYRKPPNAASHPLTSRKMDMRSITENRARHNRRFSIFQIFLGNRLKTRADARYPAPCAGSRAQSCEPGACASLEAAKKSAAARVFSRREKPRRPYGHACGMKASAPKAGGEMNPVLPMAARPFLSRGTPWEFRGGAAILFTPWRRLWRDPRCRAVGPPSCPLRKSRAEFLPVFPGIALGAHQRFQRGAQPF